MQRVVVSHRSGKRAHRAACGALRTVELRLAPRRLCWRAERTGQLLRLVSPALRAPHLPRRDTRPILSAADVSRAQTGLGSGLELQHCHRGGGQVLRRNVAIQDLTPLRPASVTPGCDDPNTRSPAAKVCGGRSWRAFWGAEERRACGQRAARSSSFSSPLFERRERSERSEFGDAAARPSTAGQSARSALDRSSEALRPAPTRLCRPQADPAQTECRPAIHLSLKGTLP